MLKSYIHTKIVTAEPDEGYGAAAGFTVYDPAGFSTWIPKAQFETEYREIDRHERKLLAMTTDEASVAKISDGPEHQSEDCLKSPHGLHKPNYHAESDTWICEYCGGVDAQPASG